MDLRLTKKLKMLRTNVEWVAQVSILRPGLFGCDPFCEEKPRSQNRDPGHPLKSGGLQLFFDRAHQTSYVALLACSPLRHTEPTVDAETKQSRRDGTACSPARQCRVTRFMSRVPEERHNTLPSSI
jgi:hypothetical protein